MDASSSALISAPGSMTSTSKASRAERERESTAGESSARMPKLREKPREDVREAGMQTASASPRGGAAPALAIVPELSAASPRDTDEAGSSWQLDEGNRAMRQRDVRMSFHVDCGSCIDVPDSGRARTWSANAASASNIVGKLFDVALVLGAVAGLSASWYGVLEHPNPADDYVWWVPPSIYSMFAVGFVTALRATSKEAGISRSVAAAAGLISLPAGLLAGAIYLFSGKTETRAVLGISSLLLLVSVVFNLIATRRT